jgi:hypothetical protein
MPSFKERFRSSRKYKKNKEAGATSIDESATTASGMSTNAPTTIDDHTGSAALSTYSSHYSVDYREYYIYIEDPKIGFHIFFLPENIE